MSHPPVIIIAEPDPIFGNMLRVEFSRAGFAVLMAGTGPEAESFARETSAHMVLLDLALPDQQCIYACARIRHRTDYWNTPIVVTAGALTSREQEAADKAKATLVLMKPYALSDLLHALMKHVSSDDPLVAPRRSQPGLAEPTGVQWGPLPPLSSKVVQTPTCQKTHACCRSCAEQAHESG